MRKQLQDELQYEIVSIRLDLSRDQLCDLITLQLPSLLDASSNKHIAFEIIALVRKNFLNSVKLMKKPPKLDKKTKKKTVRGS